VVNSKGIQANNQKCKAKHWATLEVTVQSSPSSFHKLVGAISLTYSASVRAALSKTWSRSTIFSAEFIMANSNGVTSLENTDQEMVEWRWGSSGVVVGCWHVGVGQVRCWEVKWGREREPYGQPWKMWCADPVFDRWWNESKGFGEKQYCYPDLVESPSKFLTRLYIPIRDCRDTNFFNEM